MRNASARRNNNSFIPMKYITSTHHDRDLLKRGEIILSLSLCCCCNCFYSRSNSSLLLYFPAFSPIQRLKPCHSNPYTRIHTATLNKYINQMHDGTVSWPNAFDVFCIYSYTFAFRHTHSQHTTQKKENNFNGKVANSSWNVSGINKTIKSIR